MEPRRCEQLAIHIYRVRSCSHKIRDSGRSVPVLSKLTGQHKVNPSRFVRPVLPSMDRSSLDADIASFQS